MKTFQMLYDGDPFANYATIALYIDSFAKHLGLNSLQFNESALLRVCAALTSPDFPHKDGIEKASPFKKAANFYTWFVAESPITEGLPASIIGDDLAGLPNHQNSIFAYHLVVDCLHGATLYRHGSDPVVLNERIKVSYHFFRDFVEAFGSAAPQYDFKKISLLFEQLCYKVNPVSYEEVI